MKCAECGKDFTPKPKAHNIKYCSQLCRNRVYYRNRGGAEAQRDYIYKRKQADGRDKIQCQICKKWYRQVGSHIVLMHKITAREYREAYGFDVKRGQLPEDYRRLKADQSVECGGVRNLKRGAPYRFVPGDKRAGKYKRSLETLARLKGNRFKIIIK